MLSGDLDLGAKAGTANQGKQGHWLHMLFASIILQQRGCVRCRNAWQLELVQTIMPTGPFEIGKLTVAKGVTEAGMRLKMPSNRVIQPNQRTEPIFNFLPFSSCTMNDVIGMAVCTIFRPDVYSGRNQGVNAGTADTCLPFADIQWTFASAKAQVLHLRLQRSGLLDANPWTC